MAEQTSSPWSWHTLDAKLAAIEENKVNLEKRHCLIGCVIGKPPKPSAAMNDTHTHAITYQLPEFSADLISRFLMNRLGLKHG